jgi:hypothetical protein
LRNGKSITIRTLLQSIPATEGMTRPQLFQTVEPNAASIITLVTYQAEDSALVAVRQSLLKSELWQIITDNEEDKLFTNPEEGIWFGTVTKSKPGLFTFNKAVTKESIEYSSHFNRIMHSPPFYKNDLEYVCYNYIERPIRPIALPSTSAPGLNTLYWAYF